MDYKKAALEVLQNVGGEENVISIMSCFTRVRVEVKDKDKVNDAQIKKIEGCQGLNWASNTIQIIFGGKCNDVYDELPELIFGKTRSGCIVNYRYVSRVDKNNVWCKRGVDGTEIRLDLGRGRYNDFMTDYTEYITSERGKSRRLW